MSREYDTQLLESVAARRGRLRDSLLWGRSRRQLATADNVRRFAASVLIAAVGCAGCVGWSFLRNTLAEQASPNAPAAVSPSP